MATASNLDRIPESKRAGGFINYCKSAGLITDAQVNANSTLTTLKAAVLASAQAINTANVPAVQKLLKAIDRIKVINAVPETHAVTTVAGLVALTDASTTYKQGFFD